MYTITLLESILPLGALVKECVVSVILIQVLIVLNGTTIQVLYV